MPFTSPSPPPEAPQEQHEQQPGQDYQQSHNTAPQQGERIEAIQQVPREQALLPQLRFIFYSFSSLLAWFLGHVVSVYGQQRVTPYLDEFLKWLRDMANLLEGTVNITRGQEDGQGGYDGVAGGAGGVEEMDRVVELVDMDDEQDWGISALFEERPSSPTLSEVTSPLPSPAATVAPATVAPATSAPATSTSARARGPTGRRLTN
ncbi:hypothetical protein B0T21DRAFT_9314 [Apiosordaria backusii]|uniref:Uncharacterized protein n=1 Tax=Apiosordaria backusii TaxID=314023 RepID=A0AA40EY65_9PEZI|nr:hypothetical protein B0T21DRAFT_9314 [Apiosordaria backusii]